MLAPFPLSRHSPRSIQHDAHQRIQVAHAIIRRCHAELERHFLDRAGVRLSRPRRVVANSQTAPTSEEKSQAGKE